MRWILAGLAMLALSYEAVAPKMAMAANLYGLVIGIDDYQIINPKLDGAVNDARDVADALRKGGAVDVRLLVDAAVTRDAVMAAWNDLLAKAKKDDILVFHYAGHGGQEPEHVKGSEASGYDSTLMLTGFSLSGKGTYERIVDDEMGAMFKRASDAGVKLLVVVDACHSGTMTRGFSNSALTKPKVRAVPYLPIKASEDRLPPMDPAWAQIPSELPNVYYFGAVQDHEEAPEVEIGGNIRGALSWSLAEGLRGAADANKDGVITIEELRDYVLDEVRMKLEGQQHPSVIPNKARGVVMQRNNELAFLTPTAAEAAKKSSQDGLKDIAKLLLENANKPVPAPAAKPVAVAAVSPAPAAPPAPAAKPDPVIKTIQEQVKANASAAAPVVAPRIALAIVNAPDVGALKGGLTNVDVVDVTTRPLLTWDVARRRVSSSLGDMVADFATNPAVIAEETRAFKRQVVSADVKPKGDAQADLPRVQSVADKWHLTELIKKLAEGRSLGMALNPGDAVHVAGDKVSFAIDGHNKTFFTLFNVASDGTINLIYPLNTAEVKDPLEIPLGKPYLVPLVVAAPYGADHLVAIASGEALTDLHKALREVDDKPAARTLEAALLKQLEGRTYQIGIHIIYTAEKR